MVVNDPHDSLQAPFTRMQVRVNENLQRANEQYSTASLKVADPPLSLTMPSVYSRPIPGTPRCIDKSSLR